MYNDSRYVLVNSSAVFAAQDGVTGNNVRIISMEEAEQAAIIHIKNVMSTDKESLWNNGVKINVSEEQYLMIKICWNVIILV